MGTDSATLVYGNSGSSFTLAVQVTNSEGQSAYDLDYFVSVHSGAPECLDT